MSGYTQDDLKKISAAIASGTLEVRFTHRTVRFRSLSEMLRIRDLILGEMNNGKGRKLRVFATSGKGL